MDQIVTVFLLIIGLIFSLGFGTFGIISHFEGEQRARKTAFGTSIVGGVIFLVLAVAPPPVPITAACGVIAIIIGLFVLFSLPIGRVDIEVDTPKVRFDERMIMFARARLQPGSPEYQTYYTLHPDHEAEDNLTRSQPGLLSLQSKFADRFQFASVEGSFFLTGSLREAVDGPVQDAKHQISAEKMTVYLKDLARFYGAADVGVTALQTYHVYSHIGRGTGTYGAPVPIEHMYAIAFTSEMAFDMVGSSPFPPTSMETGKQYVESARVAVQLAAAIRTLGYPARAHIDGNYRVIAPLVARDAGLGEIGRMTILMTPHQGPRVRLGVVTTDLPLVPDKRQPDQAIIDFCTFCEKCAHACPSGSIPLGPRQKTEGALRWKLNPDTCFRYWNVVGTDCARCMAVCPFSHPDTFSHNLIRWGIARSGAFRRAALWMDDLFYGRKPKPRPGPRWTQVSQTTKHNPD